jgi:hypothetical protein
MYDRRRGPEAEVMRERQRVYRRSSYQRKNLLIAALERALADAHARLARTETA